MQTNKGLFFTLLELLVGIALLLLATGTVGWKVHDVMEKSRFQTDLEQLRSRFYALHQMAVNTQTDWRGILKYNGKKWIFETFCIEQPGSRPFAPLSLSSFALSVDGKEQPLFQIEFFSSGEIHPSSRLTFRRKEKTSEWPLPKLFHKDSGDGIRKLGPIHPDEA